MCTGNLLNNLMLIFVALLWYNTVCVNQIYFSYYDTAFQSSVLDSFDTFYKAEHF